MTRSDRKAYQKGQFVVLKLSEQQIEHELLHQLGLNKYRSDKYDMLLLNCNNFSNEFLQEITGGRIALPRYLNRAARLGSIVSCIVPRRFR